MAYSKTVYVNNTTPAISAENLNKQEDELEVLDNGLSNLNDFNQSQVVYGDNRFHYDSTRLIQNKYIAPSGSIVSYNGWSISDYIPVKPSTVYVMTYGSSFTVSNNNYYALYDKNFKMIRTATTEERASNTITTTSDTAFIRNSVESIRFSEKTMIIEKAVYDLGITAFIPFYVKFVSDNREELESEISDLSDKIVEVETAISTKENMTLTVESQKR